MEFLVSLKSLPRGHTSNKALKTSTQRKTFPVIHIWNVVFIPSYFHSSEAIFINFKTVHFHWYWRGHFDVTNNNSHTIFVSTFFRYYLSYHIIDRISKKCGHMRLNRIDHVLFTWKISLVGQWKIWDPS